MHATSHWRTAYKVNISDVQFITIVYENYSSHMHVVTRAAVLAPPPSKYNSEKHLFSRTLMQKIFSEVHISLNISLKTISPVEKSNGPRSVMVEIKNAVIPEKIWKYMYVN